MKVLNREVVQSLTVLCKKQFINTKWVLINSFTNPGNRLTEFLDWDLVKGVFKLDVFTSMKKHIGKHFKNPKLQQLLEFPVLFLGALPEKTPALYSLMNYADIKLGTWYPHEGMYKIVDGMYQRGRRNLEFILFSTSNVSEIKIEQGKAKSVIASTTNNEQQTTINAYLMQM